MALALVAGAATAFYFYRHLNEEIRHRAIAQIAKHYPGLKVTVGSAHLVDGKGVRVCDVVIAEPNAEGPQPELLRIEEMLLECPTDWRQLAQGSLPIRRATVRRPVLRATRRPDGTWSVAKLLRSTHDSGQSPPIAVENGIIEILDPLKTPASLLTLRDVNLTLTPPEAIAHPTAGPGNPTASSMHRFQGLFAGEGLRRVEIEGVCNLATHALSLHGRAQGVDVSPELRASLPDVVCKKLSTLGQFELRGLAELTFDLSHDETAARPLRFNVQGRLTRGRVDTPHLPHAMTDLTASLQIDNDGVAINDLNARIGQGTVQMAYRQSGFGPQSPRLLTGIIRQLQLDRGLWDILSPRMQDEWRKYWPTGAVDADLRLDYDGATWKPRIVARCSNVSFTHYKFPCRVERGQGNITLADDRLTVDLTAFLGTRPVQLKAAVDHPFSGPSGWFVAHGDDILLDQPLLAALPEKSRNVLCSLDAHGTANFELRIWRTRPEEPPHEHLILNVNRCSVRFDKFPYPLSNIRGNVEMTDGVWELRNLEASNNTARVTCNGSLRPGPQGNELALNFDAHDVPMDEQLRDALSPNVQQVWHNLQPRGLVDLVVDLHHLTGQKTFSVGVRAQPQPQTASIEPVHFPYRLDHLEGVLVYRDGQATFQRCKAEHGPVKVASDGSFELAPDGRWRIRLENLSVDRFRADRELVRALPERLRRSVVSLNPTGLMNLRGAVEVEQSGIPTDPSRWQWDLALGLQQSCLHCGGLSFENVCGELSLSGQFHRDQLLCRGELSLDSVTTKDCQLTQVRGPIWIDDGRVLFGDWVDRPEGGAPASNPPRSPRSVSASLFGGILFVDGWVTLGPDPRYALNARLKDADLARCSQELIAGHHRVRGKILATADLTGNGWSRNAMQGRGVIRLTEGDVYELPVMISLLKLLSIRPPDQNAFSDATLNYRVEGEHIYFDRIDFRGDAISLRGKGEMDAQSAIRMTFYTLVGRGELDLPVIKQVLRGASQQLVLIHVDGTLQDPKTRQEALPALNQALQQLRDELQNRR
ncbi:MAG: AsmA-like C-terminal region-containing protein [Thermoguttaceae bacterium]